MKNSSGLVVLILVIGFALPAKAQDVTPRFEAYAGYDYMRDNATNDITHVPPSQSVNGNGESGQLEFNASLARCRGRSGWLCRGSQRICHCAPDFVSVRTSSEFPRREGHAVCPGSSGGHVGVGCDCAGIKDCFWDDGWRRNRCNGVAPFCSPSRSGRVFFDEVS